MCFWLSNGPILQMGTGIAESRWRPRAPALQQGSAHRHLPVPRGPPARHHRPELGTCPASHLPPCGDHSPAEPTPAGDSQMTGTPWATSRRRREKDDHLRGGRAVLLCPPDTKKTKAEPCGVRLHVRSVLGDPPLPPPPGDSLPSPLLIILSSSYANYPIRPRLQTYFAY